MNNLQQMINQMNAAAQYERSRIMMTLRDAADFLRGEDVRDLPVYVTINGRRHGVDSEPLSYRGYYSDCSLEPLGEGVPTKTAGAVGSALQAVIGRDLEGYKGGEYTMHDETPLWIDTYGSGCGWPVVGMRAADGQVEIQVGKQG